MADLIRRHLSVGNVIALTAFVVALSGAAYAVTTAPKSSVTSKSVKNNALKGKDVKDGKLTGDDVKQNSIQGADVAEGSLAQVPEAADAGAVGGHSAACPAATIEHQGYCFDAEPNPNSDWIGATDVCDEKGGWLPSGGQLEAIRDLAGVDLGSGTSAHWADALHYDATVIAPVRSMTVADSSALESRPLVNARPYRCVYPLVR